jgi:large conductance mechanosensitive channel
MASDFKQFLLRGNVVDLAVAVVVGVAFGALVTSFVENLITPLIAAILGEPDFSALTFTINDAVFGYGAFLNALLAFITIAAAVFFFVVRPINAAISRSRQEPTADPTTRKCPECLSEIPIAAMRCAHCAIVVEAAA